MIGAATELLHAFARSDLATIRRLCAEDVLLVGTDQGEHWQGRDAVLAAFSRAFDLAVRWTGEPVAADDWLFGTCVFTDHQSDAEQQTRVTMVFQDGLLAHAHYSVAQ
ncbi:MAG TPA: nuclear transport factor 2 family protein [Gaiellaceae bacterium]